MEMSWVYFPERWGREIGTILAKGLNKSEEYICNLREGNYVYDIQVIFNDGEEREFFIEQLDEELNKYDLSLREKCNKGEIPSDEYDMKYLKKLCRMAQKEISNR